MDEFSQGNEVPTYGFLPAPQLPFWYHLIRILRMNRTYKLEAGDSNNQIRDPKSGACGSQDGLRKGGGARKYVHQRRI